jgi:hypothetical protein
VQRGRNLEAVSTLGTHRHELLDEQGIALGGLDDPRDRFGRNVAQVGDQGLTVRLGQGLQRERDGAGSRRGPRRALVEQVRSRRAQHQERDTLRERRHILDEVQEGGLGPVDVVEDDHERVVRRDRLEQPPGPPRDLLRSRRGVHFPDRRAEPLGREVAVVRAGQDRSHVADLSGHLLERPVRDPLAVRQAPADEDSGLGASDELARQARPCRSLT